MSERDKRSSHIGAPGRKGGRARLAGIHRILKDRICFFDYPPGALLREAKLAAEFGVSRTPIRQALQQLEFERLVDVRDGVGTIVTGVEFGALRSVYELRLWIAELIGDASPADVPGDTLATIDDLIGRAAKLRAQPNVREFWRVESDRHRLINGVIGNDALKELHDRLFTQTVRVWYGIVETIWEEAMDALTDELEELRRAIVAGDVRAIGLLSRNYVSYSIARIERYFARQTNSSATPLTRLTNTAVDPYHGNMCTPLG